MMHKLRSGWLITVLAVMAGILVWTSPAAAHLEPVRSDPAEDAILDSPPHTVRLWFAGELDTFESSVVVLDSQERQIDFGNAGVSLDDRTMMQVSLPDDLSPGIYLVHWTAVDDEDTHPVDGEFTFTIAGAKEEVGSPILAASISIVAGMGVIGASIIFWRRLGAA